MQSFYFSNFFNKEKFCLSARAGKSKVLFIWSVTAVKKIFCGCIRFYSVKTFDLNGPWNTLFLWTYSF